ncbi:MAG: class I SAM-dependent methyltransferase [Candidatus Omnitrophota bacterium]
MKKRVKRDDLISLLPLDAKRVLDLGCSDGVLGAKLRPRGAEVVGIDIDARAAEAAKSRLDKVFIGDLKDIELPYEKGYFDCILCGDILDCFKDPLGILKKYIYYLKDGGCIVASMANIRYYKVIIRLLFGGTWDYVDEGIPWKHHIRFFTLINMKELFIEAGCELIEIKRNIVAARGFKIVNFLSFGTIKDLLAYQYYIKAKKIKEGPFLNIKKRKIYRF